MSDYLSSSAPQYKRLAAKYVDQINRGVFPAGERFLSVTALMREEKIARATAQAVIGELKAMGKVSTEFGSGTYVTP